MQTAITGLNMITIYIYVYCGDYVFFRKIPFMSGGRANTKKLLFLS